MSSSTANIRLDLKSTTFVGPRHNDCSLWLSLAWSILWCDFQFWCWWARRWCKLFAFAVLACISFGCCRITVCASVAEHREFFQYWLSVGLVSRQCLWGLLMRNGERRAINGGGFKPRQISIWHLSSPCVRADVVLDYECRIQVASFGWSHIHMKSACTTLSGFSPWSAINNWQDTLLPCLEIMQCMHAWMNSLISSFMSVHQFSLLTVSIVTA